MKSDKRERIIFLDMMRAFAVLLMVQGHTIDVFLADDYRSYDSLLFNIWVTIRGFTAPIFMFTSGVAFTYLFKLQNVPFEMNPRVTKGIHRFILLLLTAYLLRYPTYRVLDFSIVSREQWLTFFTVDALHLIGFGLLFIMIISYFSEKLKLNEMYLYIVSALFVFTIFNFTEKINWANYFPIPFAAYFYHGTGSLFPLFPWSGYVLSGAVLGNYLAKNPNVFKTQKFTLRLFFLGIAFLASALLTSIIQNTFWSYKYFITDNFFVIFLRLGVVLLLNSIMSFTALKLKHIPDLVTKMGTYTLLIYAAHVIILYGSAWIPGFGMFVAKTLNIPASILAAVAMIFAMFGLVYLIEKYKPRWQKKEVAVTK